MKSSKLIVLRGPSGSGKSTVAKELLVQIKQPTFLVDQDHYRFSFKPAGLDEAGKKILFSNAQIALENGYTVIMDGIFWTKTYGKYFDMLFAEHPKDSYMFYFDISFEETLRRHQMRNKKNHFTEDDMRQWYKPKDYSTFDFEQIIPETNSLKQTITMIRKVSNI
jgi:predicted kinase